MRISVFRRQFPINVMKISGLIFILTSFVILSFLLILLSSRFIYAEVCSRVSIEIPQELTLERIAFDAKMVITNNVPDKDLTDVRVDVTIQDVDGNVKNDLFYMRVSSTDGIASVDGNGIVRAATTAEIHWLIIPSPGAGGSDPAGVDYWAGATLTYNVDGNQEVVTVNPDKITVKPEAQLILDYFSPYEVLGDNPFTPSVEPPIPFPLAVRVLNAGYGPAHALKIDSAQPKIVDNAQGLLVDFRLLGASVNDSAVAPSLIVDIGTLGSKKIATAYWEMISTLSGRFVEFDVTFSHASELGGELTSLITATNAYYLTHKVKVTLPGRDNLLDFLADTDEDPERLPDMIFESEIPGGSMEPVDSQSPVLFVDVVKEPVRPTPQNPEVEMEVLTGDSGWVYTRIPDPSKGMLDLIDVLRADGVHLDPHNFWIGEGLDDNHQTVFTFHMLDYRENEFVTGHYTLIFEQPLDDTTPPNTSLIFSGPVSYGDPIYITPETIILFKATDNDGGSGVEAMYRKMIHEDPAKSDSDYIPAYPMTVDTPGNAELEYYSVDRAGNMEAFKTAYLYVDNGAPEIVSYQAEPSVFMPHAPKGIATTRKTDFMLNVTDDKNELAVTIAITKGETFSEDVVVRTLQTTALSGVDMSVTWDGKDNNGVIVPTGIYTAQVRVTDGLEGGSTIHTATKDIQVTVDEWFKGEPLDPNLSGNQTFPQVSETRVVWQDNRNGNWDIFTKVIGDTDSMAVSSDSADQTRPAIDGDIIVWQDMRNGNSDIYGYDVSLGKELIICNDPGNQERPVVSGSWISWQDDRAGNWDIYAFNMDTKEKIVVTSHERDQIHPSVSDHYLAWEDYRHGLGELYTFDLATQTESRVTYSSTFSETLPSVFGYTMAWTDQRNKQRYIYFSTPDHDGVRVTYGSGDHSQADVLNDVIIYTDFESGYDDPNLAFYDITTGLGDKLTANPARQEEPSIGSGVVVWQDNRDGVFQIYWSPFQIEAIPIGIDIKPGFNLIAVGEKLVNSYASAEALIGSIALNFGIDKVIAYNSLNGIFLDSSQSDEIALRKGMGIGIYASESGTLDIADAGEEAYYTLLPGTNYIGILTVPSGYTAYDLIESVGPENIQSVRRFNVVTGSWETASIQQIPDGKKIVGNNFVLRNGHGLIITMKNRVDGWKP